MNHRVKQIEEFKVVILMATYNGKEYIREQLDSIKKQSYNNWELIVRDDNSNDSTLNILKEYEQKDRRIKVLHDNNGNVGQCKNFDLLMQYALHENTISENSFFMFSDQDDVWNNSKVELSVKKISSVEKIATTNTPILVYTNYFVSNSQLSQIKLTYNKSVSYPRKELASRLLVQNWIMGCTTIINKSLLKLSIDIPGVAENHDNWIAVLCSLAGIIEYIDETTMTHRVHLNNITTNANTTNLLNRISRLFKRFKENDKYFKRKHLLYLIISERLYEQIDIESRLILNDYREIIESKGINAVITAHKRKFHSINIVQTTLLYLQLLMKKI